MRQLGDVMEGMLHRVSVSTKPPRDVAVPVDLPAHDGSRQGLSRRNGSRPGSWWSSRAGLASQPSRAYPPN
jgi:hypothetical protein